MSGDFDGKVVLVTGAGGGIGRAAARQFAREGAKVVVADLDLHKARAVVDRIRGEGGEAEVFQVDVADEASVEAMIAFTVESFGGLHAAFNNAGVGPAPSSFVDVTLDDWRRTIDVNLTSIFLCMRAEIRHMLAHGGGAILNNASNSVVRPPPGMPHYVASKSGVVGLTRSGAVEYAGRIRVNAILPGATDTAILHAAMPSADVLAAASARWPKGRPATPEEIASTAVWLCSDGAAHVSGVSMLVDGGMLCA